MKCCFRCKGIFSTNFKGPSIRLKAHALSGINFPKTAAVRPPTSHLKSDEQDMRATAGEVKANSLATLINGPLHMDKQVLNDRLELIFYTSGQTEDVV